MDGVFSLDAAGPLFVAMSIEEVFEENTGGMAVVYVILSSFARAFPNCTCQRLFVLSQQKQPSSPLSGWFNVFLSKELFGEVIVFLTAWKLLPFPELAHT